jgi:hypothetical protein
MSSKGCGCGVVKAVGDPNGRSISSLGGLRGASRRKVATKRIDCAWEKSRGKRKWVCRDEEGRKVKKPKARRARRKR